MIQGLCCAVMLATRIETYSCDAQTGRESAKVDKLVERCASHQWEICWETASEHVEHSRGETHTAEAMTSRLGCGEVCAMDMQALTCHIPALTPSCISVLQILLHQCRLQSLCRGVLNQCL